MPPRGGSERSPEVCAQEQTGVIAAASDPKPASALFARRLLTPPQEVLEVALPQAWVDVHLPHAFFKEPFYFGAGLSRNRGGSRGDRNFAMAVQPALRRREALPTRHARLQVHLLPLGMTRRF